MTEFEQQVAEALRAVADEQTQDGCAEIDVDGMSCARWFADILAPRVAAAIEAAANRSENAFWDSDDARAGALAALRGDKP